MLSVPTYVILLGICAEVGLARRAREMEMGNLPGLFGLHFPAAAVPLESPVCLQEE